MTATDELRRLLGEADIEYKVTSCHLCSSTEWECDLGNAVFYEDHTNGYTRVTIHYKDGMTHFQITSDLKPPERYVTPEQAIAATVGLQIVDRLRLFASCAYGIASEFMKSNGCPYYDNEMECSFSDECEEKDWAEHPDCLLDALAKALGIEVDE